MYFQEKISTASSGTNKFNFSALTIFKLKIICNFLPRITFTSFLWKCEWDWSYRTGNWLTISTSSSSLQDAILFDLWHETFVFKDFFLFKTLYDFFTFATTFFENDNFFLLLFVSALRKIVYEQTRNERNRLAIEILRHQYFIVGGPEC